MMQDRSLDGEPARLVAKALSLDPDNFKALALSGSLAFTHGDFAQAVAQWEHAVRVAPNAGLADQLQAGIDEARKRGHLPASSQASSSSGAAASAGVSGTVTLAPALRARVAAGDTVFVFARALNGPPMPLAVLRKQVGDLPLHFKLTDAMAMSPAARLSRAGQVVIVARVSKSGQAMPQTGDLEGSSAPVKVGANGVDVNIDSVVR
jgi:cytochrome c-type biogenesis protein CcmH